MCQLTFTNLHNQELNRYYVLSQSLINTLTDHQDGFGYFTKDKDNNPFLWKMKTAPTNCTNLGQHLIEINKNPVLSHVRKATFTNGFKVIGIEQSHPFETDNLVLAHNGMLELREESEFIKNDWNDKIDSQIFLHVLDHYHTLYEGDMVSALQMAYTNFYGKFAFLIYDKRLDLYYIARGNAKLFTKEIKRDGKRIGFVVNTQRESLIGGTLFLRNYIQLRNMNMDWDEEITELKENTIYFLSPKTDQLTIIGEVKEESKPVKVVSTGGEAKNFFQTTHSQIGETTTKDSLISRVYNLCLEWNITPKYLDELVFNTINKPILGCKEKDMEYFLDFVVPVIKKYTISKNIIKEWKKLGYGKYDSADLMRNINLNIQFPYLLEDDIKILREARRDHTTV